MKKNKEEIQHQLWWQLRNQLYDQPNYDLGWNETRNQVFDKIWKQIHSQVFDQVYDQVCFHYRDVIRDQMNEK